MSDAARLGEIVRRLDAVGVRCLVMGGHAVRYYGLARNTVDFDLHVATDIWPHLLERVQSAGLPTTGELVEGPSWRPNDFRRFQIGVLDDGREEFWRANHLLAPFADLWSRGELGRYGEQEMRFLSLPDLIRSKETERDRDWEDIAFLEEIHDARLARRAAAHEVALSAALADLRSRRGLEAFARDRMLADPLAVIEALRTTRQGVAQALLLPLAPAAALLDASPPLEAAVIRRLRSAVPQSALHFALVEIVRRQHRHARQEADRADKQRSAAQQRSR